VPSARKPIRTGGDPAAAPLHGPRRVPGGSLGLRARPGRAERLEAGQDPGGLDHLAGRRPVAVAERVAQAELEPVDAGGVGQLVVEGLDGRGRLRHAEAAKRTGHRVVGVDRPGARMDRRHAVGAGRVNRHPVGHGRTPARIGAGVEHRVEVERRQPAFAVASGADLDPCGMAFGRRRHRFLAAVGDP
jgi:hypothetical protein